jgi:hypothetical protein
MPNDIDTMLSAAKGTLAGANKAFPSPKSAAAAGIAGGAAKAAAPKPSISVGEPEKGIGQELAAKAKNVAQYTSALPKMHKGGTVASDGAYQLQAGEHVLTAPEAKLARKHALMAVGMKSLAKPRQTAGSVVKLNAVSQKVKR